MSDPHRTLADDLPGSLDPASRRRASRFLLQILLLTGLVSWPYLAHKQSLQGLTASLASIFALGAMFSALFTSLRREPFAKGSLNGWDEVLAFIALSRLADAAMQLQS